VDLLTTSLLVGVGSAGGGYLRYRVVRAISVGRPGLFPWGTLLVNLSGSFAAGALLRGLAAAGGVSEAVAPLLVAGFCGGYTTVSAFSLDTLYLAKRRQHRLAALNTAAAIAGTVIAAGCGFLLAGWMLS